MVENFADHPRSIAEIRSDRSSNAADWTPRDALICALRKLDSGELKPDALIVSMRLREANGGTGHYWVSASPDMYITLGVLERTIYRVQETAESVG